MTQAITSHSSPDSTPVSAIASSVVVFLLALVLRLVLIDFRPMHHDEAVNHFFVSEVFSLGYYPYSHENYHGPLYFYLLAGSVALFGDGEAALRGLSAFFGSLTAILPLVFARTLFPASQGCKTALLAAVALSLSPALVYFSRSAIHESLFVFLQLLFVGLLLQALERRTWFGWIALGAVTGCLIATKETCVIFFAAISLGALIFHFDALKTTLRRGRPGIIGAVLNTIFVTVLVYTGGFRWWTGLTELALTIPQWVGRGTVSETGHFKPFYYYLWELSAKHDPVVLLAFVVSGWIVLSSFVGAKLVAELRTARFFAVWGIFTAVVYSVIPYKTPWLYPNFVVPLLVTLSCFGARSSTLFKIVYVICFCISLRSTIIFNYPAISGARVVGPVVEDVWFGPSRPFGDGNPFSYVNSEADVLSVAAEMTTVLEADQEAKVLITCQSYWPLPYYLRRWRERVSYLPPGQLQWSDLPRLVVASPGELPPTIGVERRVFRLSTAAQCDFIKG